MALDWAYQIRMELEAENQRRREADRIERKMGRSAEAMTRDLLDRYEKYCDIVEMKLVNTDIFDFDNLKKNYIENEFKFLEVLPIKKSPIIEVEPYLPVPKASWLEKIIASKRKKRLSIIEKNKNFITETEELNRHNAEAVEVEYQEQVTLYEARKEESRLKWERTENKNREQIEKWNCQIDFLKSEYLLGENEVIKAYIDILFSTYNYALDTIAEQKNGYNKHSRKLLVDLHIADIKDIFEAEGYKWSERLGNRPIKMKVATLNERMRNLMVKVCIATFHLLFENDIGEYFDAIVVNVYYDYICCVSAEVDKATFIKHDFSTKSGITAFIQLQMQVFKQMAHGVKPFDTFGDLS